MGLRAHHYCKFNTHTHILHKFAYLLANLHLTRVDYYYLQWGPPAPMQICKSTSNSSNITTKLTNKGPAQGLC